MFMQMNANDFTRCHDVAVLVPSLQYRAMLSCRNPASFSALPDRIATNPWVLWLGPTDNQEKYLSFILQFCFHMFPQIVQSFRRGTIKMAGSVHVSTCLGVFGSARCQCEFWVHPEAAPSSPWLLHTRCGSEMSSCGQCHLRSTGTCQICFKGKMLHCTAGTAPGTQCFYLVYECTVGTTQ